MPGRGLRSEFCKTEDIAWLQLLKGEPRPAKDVDAAALDQIEKPLEGCWAWRAVGSAFSHSVVCQIKGGELCSFHFCLLVSFFQKCSFSVAC